MRWKTLLAEIDTVSANPDADAEVNDVTYDSRAVRPGTLFVAMRGGTVDGNRFVHAALAHGATAVLTDSAEQFAQMRERNFPVALVAHGRRALALASAGVFAHPERALKLTAVTGTNGKTTTAFLTEALLQQASRKCLLVGTIETHLPGLDGARETRPSAHTTPESRDLLALFREAADRGATEAVLEMSSHALDQERVFGLPVDVAIFTNLTQDHLDYHGTMQAYGTAKARLFAGVGAPPPQVAVINADDPAFTLMWTAADGCKTRWSYSLTDTSADFFAGAIRYRAGATEFVLNTPFGSAEVVTQLTGRVNVYNVLAAAAAALARGMEFDAVVGALPQLQPVPGRFETVPNSLGIAVVVDYAHTDDALRNLIALARELAGKGRVLTLFGCGGDRDRTKRAKMGAAADEESDVVIVTSDNPRSEEPAAIAEDILVGVHARCIAACEVVLDRANAIERILWLARAGDIVLIAGKGHEKTQTARGVAVPFDDVRVAADALRHLEAGIQRNTEEQDRPCN